MTTITNKFRNLILKNEPAYVTELIQTLKPCIMIARAGGPVAPYVEFCWLNGAYQLTILPMIPAAQAFVSRYDDEVCQDMMMKWWR